MPDPFVLKTPEEEWEWAEAEGLTLRPGSGPSARRNPVVPPEELRFPSRREMSEGRQLYPVEMHRQMWKARKRYGSAWNLLAQSAKLRCMAFELPSLHTCPGASHSLDLKAPERLGVCHLCYAAKGPMGIFHGSLQQMRFQFTGSPDFVDTMVEAIQRPRAYTAKKRIPGSFDLGFFRMHSSGDFFHAGYVRKWMEIASHLPQVRFWAPTRAWLATDRELLAALQELASFKNVCIRPSMPAFNDRPEDVPGFAASHTAFLYRPLTPAPIKHLGFQPAFNPAWQGQKKVLGAFVCPALRLLPPGVATRATRITHTCTESIGPDGQAPCRVCWGCDHHGRVSQAMVNTPVAFPQH